jgi:hypothetical protein
MNIEAATAAFKDSALSEIGIYTLLSQRDESDSSIP